jgi:aminoglycoside phosphotransferase (APT) family kinase protein
MSQEIKDLERKPRAHESLDLKHLLPWLEQHVPGVKGVPEITQFSGGASNLTYRLKFDQQEVILRRAPQGKKAAGAHDMVREFHLQRRLKSHFTYVPHMIAVCEDELILGSPFYVMERLDGIIPRKNLPEGIDWNRTRVQSLCYGFWDKLIELHQVDYLKEGLTDLGKGDGYVERQIIGWNKRYSDAKTWNVPKGQGVMNWLERNMPRESKLCIIHNDFRLDNIVLSRDDPDKIIGILDWELASIGDPLMDLGNSLAYWVEANDNFFIKSVRRQPSNVPGMLTRAEVIHYYANQTGQEIDDFRFYRVYGLFRLAGIAQQIYFRYAKGYTKNKAFKRFWMVSYYLIKTCENVIKGRKI